MKTSRIALFCLRPPPVTLGSLAGLRASPPRLPPLDLKLASKDNYVAAVSNIERGPCYARGRIRNRGRRTAPGLSSGPARATILSHHTTFDLQTLRSSVPTNRSCKKGRAGMFRAAFHCGLRRNPTATCAKENLAASDFV